jgi:hypothetical protein
MLSHHEPANERPPGERRPLSPVQLGGQPLDGGGAGAVFRLSPFDFGPEQGNGGSGRSLPRGVSVIWEAQREGGVVIGCFGVRRREVEAVHHAGGVSGK